MGTDKNIKSSSSKKRKNAEKWFKACVDKAFSRQGKQKSW